MLNKSILLAPNTKCTGWAKIYPKEDQIINTNTNESLMKVLNIYDSA